MIQLLIKVILKEEINLIKSNKFEKIIIKVLKNSFKVYFTIGWKEK